MKFKVNMRRAVYNSASGRVVVFLSPQNSEVFLGERNKPSGKDLGDKDELVFISWYFWICG